MSRSLEALGPDMAPDAFERLDGASGSGSPRRWMRNAAGNYAKANSSELGVAGEFGPDELLLEEDERTSSGVRMIDGTESVSESSAGSRAFSLSLTPDVSSSAVVWRG